MKRTSKTIILSLVFFAMAIWSGGCSTSNVGSTDSTGDTSNELATFGLPATIAKLEVDTVDSTSVYFNAGANTSTSADGNISSAESSDTEAIGTLYFQHRDAECGSSALIASNTVIDVLESDPDADCTSAIEIGSELADVDLALVNLAPGAALNDEGKISGKVSLPIGLVIHSPVTGVTDSYTLTVMNTFMSKKTDLSTGIAKDVLEKEMGFLMDTNSTEFIAFISEDDSKNTNLSTVPIIGGAPNDLVTLSNTPLSIRNTLAEADAGLLYLLDESFTVFRIDSTGAADELLIPNFLNDNAARFALHPTGGYLVYTADAGNGYKGLGIFDVVNSIDLGVIPFSGTKYNFLTLEADWANSSNLIITSTDQNGNKRLQKTRVSIFIEEGIAPALQTIVAKDSTSQLLKPVSDNGVKGYTFFICNNLDTNFINALCRYDASDDSITTVAEYDYNIVNLAISKDRSSFVVFELASTPHYICVHSISNEENNCIGPGIIPVASNNKNNIVSFQGSLSGTQQVAIYNMDHNFVVNPSPLQISPLARDVAAEASVTMNGAGGVPPYSFSVTSGMGTITSLGYYTAPSSANNNREEQVTITDSAGSTDVATLKIPAAGSTNTSFGANGIKNINVNNNSSAWDVLFANGNNIFVAGSIYNGSNTDMAVIKLNGTTGDLDTSFGVNGVAMIDVLGENDTAYGIAMQFDGKIVIVGEASKAGINNSVMARLTNNGVPDTSFGNSGVAFTKFGLGSSQFKDIKILGDGKILVCGRTDSGITMDNFLLARFTNDGALDTSFSSDGSTFTDFGKKGDFANSMLVQPDGFIVLGGRGKVGVLDQFALARYTPAGDLDTTFGIGGKVATPIGTQLSEINKIILEANGDIVAAGMAQNKNSTQDFALARYDSNGSLDTNFSPDGHEIFDIPLGGNSGAFSLVKSNGKYLLGGFSNPIDSNFYMMRINLDATVDQSFGNRGIVTTEITGHNEIHALLVPPVNNNIIAVGTTTSGSTTQMTVVTYWP